MLFLFLKIILSVSEIGSKDTYVITVEKVSDGKIKEEFKKIEENQKEKRLNDTYTYPHILQKENIEYTNGAVSTEVPYCSKLGVEILESGGNAVDSAICSMVCIGIINSFSSGIGGGGFILIMKKQGEKHILDSVDFREVAPEKVDVKIFQKDSLLATEGGKAITVPGEIRGMYEAHKKYGKLEWKKLFEKNIELAKSFRVTPQLERRLKKFKKQIFNDRGLRETYVRDNKLLKTGDSVNRTNYAKTLEIISNDPESFYTGTIAESLVYTIKEAGGYLTKEDLENYKPVFRKVLHGKFKGYDVFTTDLPSAGVFILEALNILECFDLNKLKEEEKDGKYPHYHILVEIFKFIYAHRGELADPKFIKNKKKLVEKIISKKNAQLKAMKIKPDRVLDKKEYEFIHGSKDDHGTSHLNVIDKDEMTVSVTTTVNLEFGARLMDPNTGIIFNNQIDDFYIPTVQNSYDLNEMPVNILVGNKRPFSSASPVILTKNNEILTLGAAGGTRIPTSIISVIFHLILGKTLENSIMAPRIHHQFIPEYTYIEHTLKHEIIDYLTSVGHKIRISPLNSIFTSVQGIHMVKNKNGIKIHKPFSDTRKGGKSYGY
ncbi:Gamma-glutamyltranspeptidase [Spraguea lophii 42_110]|uniref:Glutathione hydrolase n=1 Tax=Spraguea lophii (strain 42_110) TaxID=1358809 RepID=S7XL36_SPRLO|nr:Gamma-glutamyltranspeptidase [Spraguea lophii 42_110]